MPIIFGRDKTAILGDIKAQAICVSKLKGFVWEYSEVHI